MGEGTGLDSMKNHPNTFPKHVGVGFGWSRDVQQDFHQFHDLNTATVSGAETQTKPVEMVHRRGFFVLRVLELAQKILQV